MPKYGNSAPDPPKIDIFYFFHRQEKLLTNALPKSPQPLPGDDIKSQNVEFIPIFADLSTLSGYHLESPKLLYFKNGTFLEHSSYMKFHQNLTLFPMVYNTLPFDEVKFSLTVTSPPAKKMPIYQNAQCFRDGIRWIPNSIRYENMKIK